MSAAFDEPLFEDTDAELVRLCQAGGADAERGFAMLLERHGESIRRRAARLLGSEADGDEVVQNVLLSVLRFVDRFEPEKPFQHWLSVVTLNACRLEIRKRKGRERRHDAFRAESATIDPADLRDPILRRVLTEALGNLRESTRTCIVLRVIEGLSYQEVADHQGSSVPAAKMRVARGLRELRSELADVRGQARLNRPVGRPVSRLDKGRPTLSAG